MQDHSGILESTNEFGSHILREARARTDKEVSMNGSLTGCVVSYLYYPSDSRLISFGIVIPQKVKDLKDLSKFIYIYLYVYAHDVV